MRSAGRGKESCRFLPARLDKGAGHPHVHIVGRSSSRSLEIPTPLLLVQRGLWNKLRPPTRFGGRAIVDAVGDLGRRAGGAAGKSPKGNAVPVNDSDYSTDSSLRQRFFRAGWAAVGAEAQSSSRSTPPRLDAAARFQMLTEKSKERTWDPLSSK